MKKTLNDLILTALKNGNYEEADRLFVMMCAYVRRTTTSNTDRSQAAKQLTRTARMGARAYLPTHGDSFYAQEIDGELVITPASKSHNLKQLRNLLVNACPWHASETVEQRYEDLRVEELMAPMISENTQFKLAHGFDMPDIYDFVAIEAEFRQMVSEEIAQERAEQTEKVMTSSVEDYNEVEINQKEEETETQTKDVFMLSNHGQIAVLNVPVAFHFSDVNSLALFYVTQRYKANGGDPREMSFVCYSYQENPVVFNEVAETFFYKGDAQSFVVLQDDRLTIDFKDLKTK